MKENLNHLYPKKEETLNILSHGLGFLLSIVALPFLILKSFNFTGFWKPLSFIIYGLSMIILYAASTFYHAAKNPKKRRRLNIFDHAAIYVLIAGSYSPFCLVALDSSLGWYMFVFVWLFALAGVILKLFFTGKFDKLGLASGYFYKTINGKFNFRRITVFVCWWNFLFCRCNIIFNKKITLQSCYISCICTFR